MSDVAPALARLERLQAARNPLTAFCAESSAAGGCELAWEPSAVLDALGAPTPEDRPVLILRRLDRFPGRSRRGSVPRWARTQDLADGSSVYDSASFPIAFTELHTERQNDIDVASELGYRWGATPPDRTLVRTDRTLRAESGDVLSRTLRIHDRDALVDRRVHYYTLYTGYTLAELQNLQLLAAGELADLIAATIVGNASAPYYVFSADTQAAALATPPVQPRWFASLPQVHRNFDRPLGQLERFIHNLESHHELVKALVAGAADFHASSRADSRLLPPMAAWLGWPLRADLDEASQRNEIAYAPEFYRTVGTAGNIAAMVNRLTNWDTRIREFVRNVLVTFDASRIELLSDGRVLYMDGSTRGDTAAVPPVIGRRVPPGSLDTTQADAMFRLRTHAFEDDTAYTYDTRQARSLTPGGQPTIEGWYSRQTIGVYIVPDDSSEVFAPGDQFERIGRAIGEFLPINVRAIFVLLPGTIVEEPYDAPNTVQEVVSDVGLLEQSEAYGGAADASGDAIPEWTQFITNQLAHRSVDTTMLPVASLSRTFHSALQPLPATS